MTPGLLLTLVVVADIEGYHGHDHGNNTCCQQRRAMSIATRAVNDYRRCQQQCDVAATIRDRSNIGRCQRRRTVPTMRATMHVAGNNTRCQQPRIMPATMGDANNNALFQQQPAVSTTTGDVDSNTDGSNRERCQNHGRCEQSWAVQQLHTRFPATIHDRSNDAWCQQ